MSEDVDRALRTDRMVDDRELTDEQRILEFRQGGFSSTLRDLPEIPGYHTIWLSTTHEKDPIHRRIRMGYEPLMASEVPGGMYDSMTGGEFQGAICEKEMVAFKIKQSLYEEYMRIEHHDKPIDQEVQLRNKAHQAAHALSQRVGTEVPLMEGEGQAGLGQQTALPTFT